MRIFKIHYLIIMAFISVRYSQAQSPLYDQNWQLQTSLSDEFDSSSFKSMWGAVDFFSSGTTPIHHGQYDVSKAADYLVCCTSGEERWTYNYANGSNPRVSLGTDGTHNVLKLRTDSALGPPVNNPPNFSFPFSNGFYTGCLKTINGGAPDYTAYSYGYLEIYAKLPAGKIVGGVNYPAKIWPAFWMAYTKDSSGCRVIHDEIDIIDPGPLYEDSNGKSYSGGVGDENGNCGMSPVFMYQYDNSSTLSNSYHKYAVEWNTDRVIFYFDDTPVASMYNKPAFVMHAMEVIIGLQINPWRTFTEDSNFYYNTDGKSWNRSPQYFMVDYFRYYKLNTTGCSTNVTLLTNSDLAAYSWGVKSNLTFSNGSSSISLSSGDHKIFRAVNTITINGDFTVPIGAEFSAVPTPCN